MHFPYAEKEDNRELSASYRFKQGVHTKKATGRSRSYHFTKQGPHEEDNREVSALSFYKPESTRTRAMQLHHRLRPTDKPHAIELHQWTPHPDRFSPPSHIISPNLPYTNLKSLTAANTLPRGWGEKRQIVDVISESER